MPRPVYILCYNLGAEDRTTGLVSLFQIVEKLTVTHIKIPPDAPKGGTLIVEKEPFHIIASWMKNNVDPQDQEYEYELNLIIPGGSAIEVAKGKFRFAENRPLHRFSAAIQGQIPFKEPGIMWAECKIRKSGSAGWQIQNYPVIIEFAEAITPAKPTA